jgi:hypothetical protein
MVLEVAADAGQVSGDVDADRGQVAGRPNP